MRGDITVRLTEFEHEGKRIQYDACASCSLQEAKDYYENLRYIGSSHIIYIDGTRNEFEELHHFFKSTK